MARSNYSRRRRVIQVISLLMLLSIPLRLFCIDLDQEVLRVFGLKFGLSAMFYPFFFIVGLLIYVLYLSMKKGRIFCSHMCPMHMFLETVNGHANEAPQKHAAKVWGWGILLSLVLSQVVLSFFLPLGRQIELAATGHLPLIGIQIALFSGLLVLLVHYREKFCKKGCPYALMQMLLQSDATRFMEFSNPEKTCTNCRGCDVICPFNLRARFESRGPDCTNCNLCAEACTDELGQGNTLFHLLDDKPDSE